MHTGGRWAVTSGLLLALLSMAAWQVGAQPGMLAPASLVRYEVDFLTYLGGSGSDMVRDMTVDVEGNLYVAGVVSSADFPRTPGAIPGQSKGGGMVAKLSPTGQLLWSRVVGGRDVSYLYSVEVDRAGYVYVAGRMGPGFPTTPGAPQLKANHNCGFVGKLKPDASDWVWATYVGTGYAVRDMTLDDRGDVYATLDYFAESPEHLPAEWFANAYQKSPHSGGNHFGKSDAGLLKLSGEGKVLWASWIGGSNGNDWVASVGVGADHCPVIFLNTYSDDMPTTPEAFCKTPCKSWVGKLSEDGSRLIFGTYTGTAASTAEVPFARTHNVAVDHHGDVFIAFVSNSVPVTAGAFQSRCGGRGDFAIEKISPTGALLAATFLGGNGNETNGPDEIVVDAEGDVMVAGGSSSTDFPVTPGSLQPHNAGAGGKFPFDGIVSVLSGDLSRLLYSSYLGGTGDEMARACCFGAGGMLYVAGVTTSRDFPSKNAFQSTYGGDPGFGATPNGGQFPVGWGNGDAWAAKLRPAR
ncbi:SBBP repeat-containing protein [bacterium]|nr:SBBP repeat-containing protein [bacterium]